MTGINPEIGADNDHVIISDDDKTAVWVGVIDDLWKLGKPTGHGGPWKSTKVKADEPSDAYLIGFYDQKNLTISHQADRPVKFYIEVEPIGHGPWMIYMEVVIAPGETFDHEFSDGFQSRWIRFRTDTDCQATTWLEYK